MPLPGAYSSGTLPKTPLWRPIAGQAGNIHLPEAASQTFQVGELVSINSSGQVINLGGKSDPTATNVSSDLGTTRLTDQVLGMALTAASNGSASTSNNIEIVPATGNDFFLRVYNSTATDAELQDVQVGDFAELYRYNGAGDIQTVISAAPDGSVDKVQIVEKPDDRSATDQFPGVWVRVRPAWAVFGGIT